MKTARRLTAIALILLILCAGCTVETDLPDPFSPQKDLTQVLDAQLGLLAGQISQTEYDRALSLLQQLQPIQAERLGKGGTVQSTAETRLLRQLGRLYDRYTEKYLDGVYYWNYEGPAETLLAEYLVREDGALAPVTQPKTGWSEAESQETWLQIQGLLPDGAWDAFTRFTLFTDGENEMLAWVWAVDANGESWELAVDPVDAGDEGWFLETLLHEYCHYLTLNAQQVDYSAAPTVQTYWEAEFVARPDSYLNAFYQAFWTDYLDDRLISPESQHFFWRHEDHFVSWYSATDPAEDIAESFTYFVLWERQEGDAVWIQKLNFFYDYPELVDFRHLARERLGL